MAGGNSARDGCRFLSRLAEQTRGATLHPLKVVAGVIAPSFSRTAAASRAFLRFQGFGRKETNGARAMLMGARSSVHCAQVVSP